MSAYPDRRTHDTYRTIQIDSDTLPDEGAELNLAIRFSRTRSRRPTHFRQLCSFVITRYQDETDPSAPSTRHPSVLHLPSNHLSVSFVIRSDHRSRSVLLCVSLGWLPTFKATRVNKQKTAIEFETPILSTPSRYSRERRCNLNLTSSNHISSTRHNHRLDIASRT